MKKRFLSTLFMTATIAGLGFGVADAHPRLLSASPRQNSRVGAPAELRIGFSETLIGKFSHVDLMDGRGHPINVGPTMLATDHKQLVAAIRTKLAPGSYRVVWKAVSTDTHRVQGSYGFTVTK